MAQNCTEKRVKVKTKEELIHNTILNLSIEIVNRASESRLPVRKVNKYDFLQPVCPLEC